MTMTPIWPWLTALLLASLKGSILLLAALGAVRLMRRSSAEARHAVLAAGLVAFFILPAAELIAPTWAVPRRFIPAVSDGLTGGTTSSAPTVAPDVPTAPNGPSADDARGETPPSTAGESSPSASVTAATDGASRLLTGISWPAALVTLWIIGTFATTLRLLVGVARLRLMSRRATMVTDGAWLQTAHALARRLGLTRGVTLLRGDREAVPMTWGVLSPVVWLPPAADRWPAELRSAVLSHELAHVRRRDAITQWLANAVLVVHWFNPLAWIATRALRAERERACDDAVLSLGIEADSYASQLLDMVRTLGDAGGPAPAMAMARRSQFEGRLLAILDRAVSRAPVGTARLAALSAMAAFLVLVLGGMRRSAAVDPATRVAVTDSVIVRQAIPMTLPPIGTEQRAPRAGPMESRGTAPSTPSDASTLAAPPNNAKTTAAGTSTAPASATTAAAVGKDTAAQVAVMVSTQSPDVVESSPLLARRPAAAAPPSVSSSALIGAIQATTRRDTTLMLEIIAAAEGISSNSDRVAVLERMAKRPNLEPEVVSALGRAAGRITSTMERTKLLRTLVQSQPDATGASRRAVLDAIGTMTVSPEQAMLLMEFINRPKLSEDAFADALTTSEKIMSSSEKARVLTAASRLRKIEGTARASYLRSARSITSDSERARALTALVDGPGTGPAENTKPPTQGGHG